MLICTENYLETDGVAMGSPLGPVLGGTFMMKLEKTIVPQLNEYLKI